MPIILTTPFSPGDLDPEAKDGYPACQLKSLWHNPMSMSVTLSYEFGTATGEHYETWTRGRGAPTQTVDVSGAEVAALWGQLPVDGECVGVAIRRLTYQYLINKGLAVGTIADAPPLPPAGPAAPATAPTNSAAPATSPGTSASSAAPTTSPGTSASSAAPTGP